MDREHTIMKYRILIADASEENRSILSAMLGEQYEISMAENGTEAARLLKGVGGGEGYAGRSRENCGADARSQRGI